MVGNYQNLFIKNTIAIRLVILFLVLSFIPVFGQDEPLRVFMYLNYYQTDDDQYLETELKYRQEGNFIQLEGVKVDFYLEKDSSDIKLGSGVTELNGKTRLHLKDYTIQKDSSGFAHYYSQFNGSDAYKKAQKSLSIKEIDFSLESEIVDSIPTLTVKGYEKSGTDKSPIEDADLQIFVKRLYSDLPIHSGSIEDGLFSYEFPKDIPGDASGDLWIIARITDHDDYGTVETREKIRWGQPVSFVLQQKPRALWSRAPLWILIGFWVAFILVWYHYFFAISKLFGIKKL